MGGTVAFFSRAQLSELLGWYGTLGAALAIVSAGAVIGFVAGLASRTWAGLGTLVLGLFVAGLAAGVGTMTDRYDVFSAVTAAFVSLALFGVPGYMVAAGIAYLIRWIARVALSPSP